MAFEWFPQMAGDRHPGRNFSNLHPFPSLIIYTFIFVLTLYSIQKFDDVGSGWEYRKPEETQTCKIEVLADGPVVYQPTCNDKDMREVVSPDWTRPEMRADEPGFCTPRAPWFWYDLGGTMCVCEKGWSIEAYWQKTFTSFAFNFPHFMTPFQIYLVYQKWTWVFIYINFNEVFEELCLALTGTWGFTFDPPYDLESRYDTFIRDVLLCGTPGLMFGIFFVSTMKIPTFLVSPMKSSWFETGRDTKKHHLKILFQMLVLKQITLIYNTDYGTNRFYPQNILLIFINVGLIVSFYYQNRHDYLPHVQPVVLRYHVVWAMFSIVVWAFTIYPVIDELYLVLAAQATSWMVMLVIRVYTRHSDYASMTILGMPLGVARLSLDDYEQWVATGVIPTKIPDNGLELSSVAKAVELLQSQNKKRVKLSDLVAAVGEATNRQIVARQNDYSNALQHTEEIDDVPMKPLNTGAPAGEDKSVGGAVEEETGNFQSYFQKNEEELMIVEGDIVQMDTVQATGMSQLKVAWYTMCFVLAFIVFVVCFTEPYLYVGLMYRRHWCGVIIGEGGNGCIQMLSDDMGKISI
mmetsp:Transcript_89427/g.130855  ORF Transcript_89427/g.130855 Transcript_89427/m.130855 type:complete len:576 (-) Transcript_89427:89-1816(-)